MPMRTHNGSVVVGLLLERAAGARGTCAIAARASSNHSSKPSPSSFTTRAHVGQRVADHLLLAFEQREREVVAVLVGELR